MNLVKIPKEIFVVAAIIVGAIAFVLFSKKTPEKMPNAQALSIINPERDACIEKRHKLITEIHQHLDKKEYERAYELAHSCSTALDDIELKDLENKAHAYQFRNLLTTPGGSPTSRLVALEMLESIDSTATAEFASLRKELTIAQEKRIQIEKKEVNASQLRESIKKRHEGVSIGMSSKDVLASSWGKPKQVNRTISNNGISEQWVYRGHSYLYFEDGVLTTIQTGN